MSSERFSELESALTASVEGLIAGRGGEAGTTAGGWEQALARPTRAATVAVPGASFAGMTMRGRDGPTMNVDQG